jgi:DtxR family Mn-dependent transcriptional regulator
MGIWPLTPSGRKLASEVYRRHKVLKAYLLKIGVSETNAEKDCCQIEHVISRETFLAIEKLLK